MKKSYVKPELKVEVLELNQAIAACETQGYYKLDFLGYGCQWCRNVNYYEGGTDNENNTLYSSTEAVHDYHWKMHNSKSPAMGVYNVMLNGEHVAYYEDLNYDGMTGDNKQCVHDNNIWGNYFQS